MRTMYWRPIMLFSWLLIPGVQAAWAQGGPAGQYFYQQGGPPAMYGDPNGMPGYSGMEQPGYPPNAQAWPGTEMYGPGINQHYMNNGFWFNRIISGKSRYFLTMEGLVTRTSAPTHHQIGAEGVNPLTPESAAVLGGGTTNQTAASLHNQQFFETTGRTNSPDRSSSVTTTGGGGGGGGGGTTGGSADLPIFQLQDAGKLQQHFGSGGLRASWGWWNPDGSGFMAQGFWQDKARSNFYLGDRSLDLNVLGANGNPNFNVNFETHIRPWFGLPLPGTDRDEDGLNGVVVPYDLFVDFRFWSQTYGGNLDWYFTPIYDRDYFQIRPVTGVRYLTVNESFQFTAADSGLGYTLGAVSSTGTGGTGGGAGGGTGASTGQNSLDLRITTLETGFSDPDPFGSLLLARSETQFAGPEAGLRFDLGSERTKIWFQSKFGLLAGYNKRSVSGYGIGDHYNILDSDPDVTGDGVPDNPIRQVGRNGSTFEDNKSTTTMAPMFEQGIFLQAPILSYVPIIKKMSVFEKAEFQAGYTITMLGNVFRPTNNIDWQQYPNLPTVGSGRSLFYTSNWSVGVNWTY